jgi:hypothetical protein
MKAELSDIQEGNIVTLLKVSKSYTWTGRATKRGKNWFIAKLNDPDLGYELTYSTWNIWDEIIIHNQTKNGRLP